MTDKETEMVDKYLRSLGIKPPEDQGPGDKKETGVPRRPRKPNLSGSAAVPLPPEKPQEGNTAPKAERTPARSR